MRLALSDDVDTLPLSLSPHPTFEFVGRGQLIEFVSLPDNDHHFGDNHEGDNYFGYSSDEGSYI